jgi:hypothetical protein
MRIRLSSATPDTLACETLVLGFFSDERPPRGFCGQVDWRLNGLISTGIARGRLSGDYLEKAACAFPERIPVDRLLLIGLGALADLTYDRLYNAGYETARTIKGIGATELGLPIPAAGRGPLPLIGMTEVLFTGLFDAWQHEPPREPVAVLEIPAGADQAKEVRQGLDRFRLRVDAVRIEVTGPEGHEDFSPSPVADPLIDAGN